LARASGGYKYFVPDGTWESGNPVDEIFTAFPDHA
jgi:hypothetical protein